jgi:hypothetical protein
LKPALRDYLLTHSSYSVDDFTSVENSWALCISICEISSVLVLWHVLHPLVWPKEGSMERE